MDHIEKTLTIDLNKKLASLYQNFLVNFVKLFNDEEKKNLSLPILMQVFPDYFQAKHKILFVGKETYKWYGNMLESEKLNVEYLMNKYQKFEFARTHHGKNSPFWRFLPLLYKKLNSASPRNGFMWTNFSKVDQSKTTPTIQIQEKSIIGFQLLKEEIRILNPDIVIFLTSWKYDNMIRQVFENTDFKIIEPRYLSQLDHKSFPELTFRTYHPTYLNQSKQFEKVLNSIVNHCLK